MYLNIMTRSGNRKYLSIVHGYRDENGKVKKKTIRSLGYLDELEKEFDDPISHFRAVAKEMDEKRKQEDASCSISLSRDERLSDDADYTKNFGYAAYSSIYHHLGIHNFLKNRQRHSDDNFDANVIMQLLTYSKLLHPSSEASCFEDRSLLFEKDSYSYEDYNRALFFLYSYKDDLQLWLDNEIKRSYGRDDTLIYYSINNHCSQTHVIKIGVFMDSSGVPISYELFPCNSNYNASQHPNFPKIRSTFGINKVITVSDKTISNDDTIWNILNSPTNDGYIFNMSIHGTSRETKQFILDESDYQWIGDDYKVKSRQYSRPIEVTLPDGRSAAKIITEKQVVFYSGKYAKRAKGSTFDGYHLLITSECNEDDKKIVDIYRGLWAAESHFRLTKKKLETRPMCISVHDYIEIHLLSCFVSLVIASLLHIKIGKCCTIDEMLSSLSKANCVRINENLYLFSYYDEVLRLIGEKTGINFDKRIMSLQDIKKTLGNTKKS